MAFVFADRTTERTESEGVLTTIELVGTITGFKPFLQAGVVDIGDTFHILVKHISALLGEWQVCEGTLASATEITVGAVLSSSNANAAVNFSAGYKYVILDVDASLLAEMLSGTIDASRLPIIPIAKGGFGQDMSVSGGANFVVKQAAGGAFSSAALIEAEIPNISASKINAGIFGGARGGLGADASAFTGLLKMTAGVASVATAGTDYLTTINWESPGTIGSTTPNTGVFTNVQFGPAGAALGAARTVINPAASGKGLLMKLGTTPGNAIEIQPNGSTTPVYSWDGVGTSTYQTQTAGSGNNAIVIKDFEGNPRFNFFYGGGVQISAIPATSGVTSTNPGTISWVSNRWNGSASVPETMSIGLTRYDSGAGRLRWGVTDTASGIPLAIDGSGSKQVTIGFDFPAAVQLTTLGQFHVRNAAATTPVATFRGFTSQSANLTEWQVVAGTAVASVGPTGVGRFAGLRIDTSRTPASAAASGVAGTIEWDTDFIYVAVGTNTWKRVAIATW